MVDPFAAAHPGTFSAGGVRVRRRTGPHRNEACRTDLCTRDSARREPVTSSTSHTTSSRTKCPTTWRCCWPTNSTMRACCAASPSSNSSSPASSEHGRRHNACVATLLPEFARPARARDGRLRPRPRTCGVTAPRHPLGRPRVLLRLLPTKGSQSGFTVMATDLSAPTMQLLSRVSSELRRPVRTLGAMRLSSRCPMAAPTLSLSCTCSSIWTCHCRRCSHRSTAPGSTTRGGGRSVRGRARACYGHVQRFDATALRLLASRITDQQKGFVQGVHDYHGGWLILDR